MGYVQSLAIPKGIKIVCPCCNLQIATVLKDIFKGEKLEARYFQAIDGKIEDGGFMNCPRCYQSFFQFKKIHTDIGWLPKN